MVKLVPMLRLWSLASSSGNIYRNELLSEKVCPQCLFLVKMLIKSHVVAYCLLQRNGVICKRHTFLLTHYLSIIVKYYKQLGHSISCSYNSIGKCFTGTVMNYLECVSLPSVNPSPKISILMWMFYCRQKGGNTSLTLISKAMKGAYLGKQNFPGNSCPLVPTFLLCSVEVWWLHFFPTTLFD